jgi:multidrug transporter EmrE-like cation transporter|tara:strand:+ start:27 stop:254 length:228 start_codon:yes stop_codon:yes gene_type:complete
MKNKRPQKKQRNPYLIFIGLVFQMGAIIFCFSKIGKHLDNSYDSEKLLTSIFTITGVIISFYILIKQLKSINSKL